MVRFHVGVYDDKQKEVWSAGNKRVEGNMLVTMGLKYGGEDERMADHYKEALVELKQMSRKVQGISHCAILCTTDMQLERVFQVLVNSLGVSHHGFTVTDLTKGEGIGFNARERVVYEIYPAR